MPPRFVPKELARTAPPGADLGGVVRGWLQRHQQPTAEEQYLAGLPAHLGGAGRQLTQEEMPRGAGPGVFRRFIQTLTSGDLGRAVSPQNLWEQLTGTSAEEGGAWEDVRRWAKETPGGEYLQRAEDIRVDPTAMRRFLQSYGSEVLAGAQPKTEPTSAQQRLTRLFTGTPKVEEPGITAPMETVARAEQHTARQSFSTFILNYPEKGTFVHQPDGWHRNGPATYDPLDPADIPLRQTREDRMRTALTEYLGQAPTDDQLVTALVRNGDIPVPPPLTYTQATTGPTMGAAGAPASDMNLRWYLSQPNNPASPIPGKGNLQLQGEVSAAIKSAAIGPGAVGEFTKLGEPLDLLIRFVGRNIGEVPALGLEAVGAKGAAGAMRGTVAERILGEAAFLALPVFGFGPKGMLDVAKGVVKAPGIAARILTYKSPEAVEAGARIIPIEEWTAEAANLIADYDRQAAEVVSRLPQADELAITGGWSKAYLQTIAAGRELSLAAARKVAKPSPYGGGLTTRLTINTPEEAKGLLVRLAKETEDYAARATAKVATLTGKRNAIQTLLDHVSPKAAEVVEGAVEETAAQKWLRAFKPGPGGIVAGPGWRGKIESAALAFKDVLTAAEKMASNPEGIIEKTGARMVGKDVLSGVTLRFWAATAGKRAQKVTPELLESLFGEGIPEDTIIAANVPDGAGGVRPVLGRLVRYAEGTAEEGGVKITALPGATVKGAGLDPDKVIVTLEPAERLLGRVVPSAGEQVRVPMGQVTFQFTPKGAKEYQNLVDEAIEHIQRNILPRGKNRLANQTLLQHLTDVDVIGIEKQTVATTADLQAEYRAALDNFYDTTKSGWLPLNETPSEQMLRIERTSAGVAGEKLLREQVHPSGAGTKKAEAFYEAKARVSGGIRKVLLEGGPAVPTDTETIASLEALDRYDPGKQIANMMGAMTKPELLAVVHNSPAENWGLAGDALRGLKGTKLERRVMQGLIQQYVSMETTNATWVKVLVGGEWQNVRLASRDAVNAAAKPWVKRLMTQPGKALQLWKGRIASGAEEQVALFNRVFKVPKDVVAVADAIAPQDTTKLNNALKTLSEKKADDLRGFIASNEIYAQYYPEWFSGLPASVKKPLKLIRGINAHLHDWATVVGARDVAAATLNRYALVPEVRNIIDQEIIKNGTLLDVTLAALDHAHANGKTLWDVMSTGESLALSEPMAYMQSILNELTRKAIADLALPGMKITRDDIMHYGGKWEIKSLNKWPKELRADLQAFGEVMESKLPDAMGLTRFCQGMAQGILTADANIVSLQLFPALAMSFIHDAFAGVGAAAGVIGKAAVVGPAVLTEEKALAQAVGGGGVTIGWKSSRTLDLLHNIWNITSDSGFHAWTRTNLDELLFNASKGIRTGMEAFVAGALPTKPWWAVGPLQQVNAFNDLQFNRWLLVMKTMGVRQHAEMAKVLRLIPQPTALKFIRGVPGLTNVVKEAGGEATYINGLPEDVYGAICRVVNNQFGGLSLRGQAMGTSRLAVENIGLIVPSFFRAQAGMVATGLTRPNTLEGWLTITGMAQEAAFAAMLAEGLSMATGNVHKVNLLDPSRSDWLAAQTDAGYIPILPRAGLAHLLGRAVKAIGAENPTQSLGTAFSNFALGRLNPAVSLALQQRAGRDFLGRKYSDNWDRMVGAVTAFMPIFMSQTIQDMREGVKEKGWGSLTWQSVLEETGMQWLGKNEIPRAPVDKLDDISHAWSGSKDRDWFQLTQTEQEHLRANNPMAAAAWAQYEYYNSRRNTPVEDQQDSLFKDLENYRMQVRQDPAAVKFRNEDGTVTTSEQDWQLLQAKQITGGQYTARAKYRSQKIADHNDFIVEQLRDLGTDLDKSRQKNLEKYTKFHDQLSFFGLVDLAKFEYQQIQPEDYSETVVRAGTTYDETDWDGFFAARQRALDAYPLEIRFAVQQAMRKGEDEGLRRYYTASQDRRTIEEMPRYNNLTKEQGDKLDVILEQAGNLVTSVRTQMGLPPGASLPSGAAKALRRTAILDMQQRGLIRTQDDMKLATLAMMMIEESKLADRMRNVDVSYAIIAHPDVALFYPYLITWVRSDLRNRLPEIVLAGQEYAPEAAFQRYYEEQ